MSEENTFGKWLHQRRRGLDLTQQELADQAGCARITLSRIEAGTLKPSKELALILLDKLGLPKEEHSKWLTFARGLSGYPIESPGWPAKRSPTNLPISLTSFIGREKERKDVGNLIDKHRLVTLTGSGGVGKTRLALQIGAELSDSFPNGVWFVDLSPLNDPGLVPQTLLTTMGLFEQTGKSNRQLLQDFLRERNLLIILDNCEHLIEACATLVKELLSHCASLKILATSREALGVEGEMAWRVPSLSSPDPATSRQPEQLIQYESVRLFIERASLAIPNFTVNKENGYAIAQICQRLDGIPLAIELAAGKLHVLSVRQIAQFLDDRFRLLTGENRTTPPRHQTLQAAIDWSYDLLSSAEKILFMRLSVFVNGWTLEAAESVCSDKDVRTKSALRSKDILGLLTQLVNKSLVTTEERNGEVRYGTLETIRQFAGGKLQEANESQTLCDLHLEYFLHLAEAAAPHLICPEQLEWLERLDTDYENLRTALKWALGKARPECSLRLVASLGMFWYLHSYWLEGAKWLEIVLSKSVAGLTIEEKTSRARALYWDANIAQEMNNVRRALDSGQASLALCEAGKDRRDLAIARFEVGWALSRLEDYENAQYFLEQSLIEFRELQEMFWEAITEHWLSAILLAKGEKSPGEMFVHYLELARRIGERLILIIALDDVARWEWRNRKFEQAEAHLKEYELICDRLGFKAHPVSLYHGLISHCRHDIQQARLMYTMYKKQLELIGDNGRKSNALEYLGILERDEGNLQQARYYIEEALKIAEENGSTARIGFRLALLGHIEFLQGNLEDSKRDFKAGLSGVRAIQSRYSKSNTLFIFSNTYADLQPQVVAQILGAVDSYYKNVINEPIDPLMIRETTQATAHARRYLDEFAFNIAWTQGEKISLNQAIDLALRTVEDM